MVAGLLLGMLAGKGALAVPVRPPRITGTPRWLGYSVVVPDSVSLFA